MQELKIIKVVLKDENRQMTYKETEYDDFQASSDDPVIQKHIQIALKGFVGQPDSVKWSVTCERE
jgi:hypothetical protein